MVRFLSNSDVEKALDIDICIDVLEDAYRELGNNYAMNIPRVDILSPLSDGVFHGFKTISGVIPTEWFLQKT